jgi:transketolase C-terminal domain/subunit
LVCKLTEVHAAPSTQAAQQQPDMLDVMLTVENHAAGSSVGSPVADVCVQMCASGSSSSTSSSGVVWCDKVQGEVSRWGSGED